MYIAHGLADEKVSIEMSEGMAASLQRVGVEHVFEKVPGGGHTYANWPDAVIQRACTFVVSHL
jgi:dipeptidyl aminopeptidase/acylaminoacyl peptidase